MIKKPHNTFDVIVIGGGHAGIEASIASSKIGCSTLLVSQDFKSIGRLSCNPSIGGSAKGHLVKEIDALGGVMPLLADRSGLLFKMLNKSKGPAVWSPRSQNDKDLYPLYAQHYISTTKNLQTFGGVIEEILVEKDCVYGVRLAGNEEIRCRCVVLCTGTFLNGVLHTGKSQQAGGRIGEKASKNVSDVLSAYGLERGRLKTGTPPRISTSSIDVSKTEFVYGDDAPVPFSHKSADVRNTLCCYLTHTNLTTHEILQEGFADSPMYSGRIQGAGPRYCPSIEDKISRFAERQSHQIILEPEGLGCDTVYVNGFSTSLPESVQKRALQSIPGLEKCHVQRLGYAVEYDFFFPYQLKHSLESKAISGLFLAGQINGTSGYEEAAAQGLVAGINAAQSIRDAEPLRLSRAESYIGVMIDDLVNKNTEEPYRIFTSLAEYRLLLRQDNAAQRLLHYGVQLGLIDSEAEDKFNASNNAIKNLRIFCDQTKAPLTQNSLKNDQVNQDKESRSITELVKRPENSLDSVLNSFRVSNRDAQPPFVKHADIVLGVEFDIKYEGYLKRMLLDIEKFRKSETKKIPLDFDYTTLKSLSTEALLKLKKIRPETLGQASRISGISATDLSILTLYLSK